MTEVAKHIRLVRIEHGIVILYKRPAKCFFTSLLFAVTVQ